MKLFLYFLKLHKASIACLFFVLFSIFQDANECWLQMMRVLQQKLEPLEPETPMEVNLLFFFALVKEIISIDNSILSYDHTSAWLDFLGYTFVVFYGLLCALKVYLFVLFCLG